MLARDIFFGMLIRWLRFYGLEMHTDRNGHSYVCKRRAKTKRFTRVDGSR